jgi:DinB superfamily/Pentapeptide repeats (8 copies)
MAESFEFRDLAGSEFWGVDLRGAQFRNVDLTDVAMQGVFLVNVAIDGLVDRMVINGVDVTEYVNERDSLYPLRALVRPSDPDGTRAAWAALDAEWTATIARAGELPGAVVHESVDGEWSFVQTLRHLVFATDKWFTAPILGEAFDPMGLANTGSVDFPWPGLDSDADPTFAEAVAAHADRWARVHEYVARVTAADLTTTVDVLENGPNPILECLATVFEEEFAHHRYATRDLDRLEADR